jgi:hypothetical protein
MRRDQARGHHGVVAEGCLDARQRAGARLEIAATADMEQGELLGVAVHALDRELDALDRRGQGDGFEAQAQELEQLVCVEGGVRGLEALTVAPGVIEVQLELERGEGLAAGGEAGQRTIQDALEGEGDAAAIVVGGLELSVFADGVAQRAGLQR